MSAKPFAGRMQPACLLALTSLLPSLAHAQAASEPAHLSEILIVGHGDHPITVQPRGLSVSLGETEFQAINALNVEDLMKYAPNFFVRKRFAGDDNAVVALRGANTVQSARTLVLVDGFVVSNFLGNRYDYPPKWNLVGPAEVRQFDLVYGPYSARYGGNSMGGVISVTTRAPDRNEVYAQTQSMIMPFREYGIDEAFSGYSAEGGFSWRPNTSPFHMRAGFRHFENIGQPMTYTLLTPSSGGGTPVTGPLVDPRLATPVFGAASPVHVIQDQLRLRAGVDYASGWSVEAIGSIWMTDQDLTNTRTFMKDGSGTSIAQGKVSFGGKTWTAAGLNMSLTQRAEYLLGLKADGKMADWETRFNLSRYWIGRQDMRTSKDYLTGASNGVGLQTLGRQPGWWTSDLTLSREISRHDFALGLSANLYETDQDSYASANWKDGTTPIFSSASYGKTRLLGVFAEDRIDLGDGYSLTAGLRFEDWRAFDGGLAKPLNGRRLDAAYASRSQRSISPKLSFQGPLAEGWTAQLSLGLATRYPTVGELFQGRIDDVSQQIDPQSFDPNLRPEKSKDINLILRHDFGPIRSTGSLFFQDMEDSIFSFNGLNAYGNVVSSYKNVDLVRQFGMELILEARDLLMDGLDIDGNVSWMDAQTVKNTSAPAAEGVQFPRIPRWRSNGNLRYRLTDRMRASLGWRYATRPNSDLFGLSRGDAYGFQSEYFTVDGRITVKLSEQAELGVGVDNLFNDQAYVAHPLPQRSFIIDLKSRW